MMAVEPTVPNWMVPPLTLPLMLVVCGGAERVMSPVSFDEASVHLRTNVPEKEPLYVPFQVPDSAPPAAVVGVAPVGDVVLLAAVVAVVEGSEVVVTAAPVVVVLLLFGDELHAASSRAAAPTNIASLVRDMSSLLKACSRSLC